MDETKFLFNSWKTSLELANDRGFKVDTNYNKVSIKEFKFMINDKDSGIDIVCYENNKDPNHMLYIKFILALKIKPSSIKEIYEEINQKISDTKKVDIILILKSKPNNSILKLEKDKSYTNIQIYWCKQLQFNVTKHELVPVHKKLCEEDSKDVLKRYSLSGKQQLPLLLKDDVISKYYNYKSGDIIEITHTNTSQNREYTFYRCVR